MSSPRGSSPKRIKLSKRGQGMLRGMRGRFFHTYKVPCRGAGKSNLVTIADRMGLKYYRKTIVNLCKRISKALKDGLKDPLTPSELNTIQTAFAQSHPKVIQRAAQIVQKKTPHLEHKNALKFAKAAHAKAHKQVMQEMKMKNMVSRYSGQPLLKPTYTPPGYVPIPGYSG